MKTVNIKDDLHRTLKTEASEKGIGLNQLLDEILENYVIR